ncbi:MarR family winged helix-turn-helix transcriptional regulator [Aquimarina sp. 2201CG14-23]|uniref:MarR family winged helix-turn-helix transcriptional regulator n=1 Tax=Aquimarina mycalae TaxID=3040073 RepID=UPI002478154D|nr:MarR family transcriptional regulator [Aquimarina sp. 2201CG14-23]MDH7444541.1 MarR family transcriptional regulator [Aquimarina sp. 2201CG14-23]
MNIETILKTNKEMPLSRKAIVNLFFTEKWLTEQMNTSLKPYDISIQQFNVLRILKGQQGKPANLSTIQDRMVSKMSNTTRLVDKLIKKSLVHRNICPSNRRKVEIIITSEGSKFLDSVSKTITSLEHKLTANLTDTELEQLDQLLTKLRT